MVGYGQSFSRQKPGDLSTLSYCLPVNYTQTAPYSFITELLNSTYLWLYNFYQQNTPSTLAINELGVELIKNIFAQMYTCVDFFKSPRFLWEQELRFMQDANNGQLSAVNIQHHDVAKKRPFLFFNLRLASGLMPITEIIVGPNTDYPSSLIMVQDILHQNGYSPNTPVIQGASNFRSD